MRKAIGGTPCFHYRSVSPSGSRHQDAVGRAAARQFGGGDATTGARSSSSARSQSNPIRAELELCAPRSAKSSAYASVFYGFCWIESLRQGVPLAAQRRGCAESDGSAPSSTWAVVRPTTLWCSGVGCG